ncbi:hypothetical protein ET418_07965 [Oryzomonas rubra]|uniref:Uncharacterized protein n=1 Tax=Oryzomonas rubra TaxID=2509454 RepID=A0A5A9XJ83_9BACT|nr:hypothetical protein ET418_07965 [Oryzomonas rubra]
MFCGLVAFTAWPGSCLAASSRPFTIAISVPPSLLDRPTARLAIDDSSALLSRAFPSASIGRAPGGADVVIRLPEVPAPGAPAHAPSPADSSYRWRSTRRRGVTTLKLTASTPEGVACGLYALLQEKLAIRFIHPRETLYPSYRSWPLKPVFTFEGSPRFSNRGFHLHTLHPIELTEPLLNPALPGGFDAVREYIDWLARNGQNTMQFFLLRGIDRTVWIGHAARIVEYAHRRGVRCGVEISLAMLQQQAFQSLVLLRPYPSYTSQVDATLAWLFRVPWDFVTLEPTMGEYLPVLSRLLPGVQRHMEREVVRRYGSRLMFATHVIASDSGAKVRRPLEPTSGILIHTVMCYSVSEPHAPVYGNVNQCFMLDAARDEARRRETWYWPESSYWVGFDSPVPLLLLPYLDSRWSDMDQMARLGVAGHLTFTSGWEWGYWLMDWSIARWSWRFSDDGCPQGNGPLTPLDDLLPDQRLHGLWSEALRLQNRYLKERGLMRYLAALAPFSELPHPFDRPFQPDPGFRYSWLLNAAPRGEAAAVLTGPVADMEAYDVAMSALAERIDARLAHFEAAQGDRFRAPLHVARELNIGLRVTALRARHRALTLRALVAKRPEEGEAPNRSEALLARAAMVRGEALTLVARQEQGYRYPLERIARRTTNLTAYSFGYLYPVSRLFYWEREEEQVRHRRFDAFFMNLWDFRRTLGLGSVFR